MCGLHQTKPGPWTTSVPGKLAVLEDVINEDLWHAETETETSAPGKLVNYGLQTVDGGLWTADYGQSCK